jgi:hypothetical protein
MGTSRALPVFPKVGNSQNEVAPPFPRFLREGGATRSENLMKGYASPRVRE